MICWTMQEANSPKDRLMICIGKTKFGSVLIKVHCQTFGQSTSGLTHFAQKKKNKKKTTLNKNKGLNPHITYRDGIWSLWRSPENFHCLCLKFRKPVYIIYITLPAIFFTMQFAYLTSVPLVDAHWWRNKAVEMHVSELLMGYYVDIKIQENNANVSNNWLKVSLRPSL